MKILFVSSQFPNSIQPDLGVFSLQVVKQFAVKDEIQVIAPLPTLGMFNFAGDLKRYNTNLNIPTKEIIDNILVYHPKYFAFPAMGFTHHIAMYVSLMPLIKSIHFDWGIDVINCHWLFPDGVAVQRIGKKLGIPVMLTALGCDLNRYTKRPMRKYVIKNAMNASERVSVLNSDMYEKCIDLGVDSNRLRIIPNGVDLDRFKIQDKKESQIKLGFSGSDRIILFVGSLVEVKNTDTLLKAFKHVLKNKTDCKLVLVGSGYLEKDLIKLSQLLGIETSVSFIGQVNHEKLTVWMNAADCLCLPSIREGHPNVMMEALACGIPVVASSVGSLPDFINIYNGCLIDSPLDCEEMAEKLLTCLKRSYDRKLIRSSVENYSWSNCAQSYLDALRCLI